LGVKMDYSHLLRCCCIFEFFWAARRLDEYILYELWSFALDMFKSVLVLIWYKV
jgi:hypothetical protein